MSAWVEVINVKLLSPNPAPISSEISFEISFQCVRPLSEELTWTLVYVGSVEDASHDQELDTVGLSAPLPEGRLKFVFNADPPNFSVIDPDELLGVTVILLEGTYRSQEFVRIGWYVHNVYMNQEMQDSPPDVPELDKMARFIIVDEPRVTRFLIDWDGSGFHHPLLSSGGLPSIPSSNLNNDPSQNNIGGNNSNNNNSVNNNSEINNNNINNNLLIINSADDNLSSSFERSMSLKNEDLMSSEDIEMCHPSDISNCNDDIIMATEIDSSFRPLNVIS